MVGGIRFMKWMMGCSGKFCEFCIYVRFSSVSFVRVLKLSHRTCLISDSPLSRSVRWETRTNDS